MNFFSGKGRESTRAAGILGILFLLVTGSACYAENTLEKIVRTGTLSLGYRKDKFPLSYEDEQKRPQGYVVDICLKVADAVRRELKRPNIAVKFVPISSDSRSEALLDGTIDIECGTSTNTAKRRRELSPSITLFFASGRLMVLDGKGYKNLYSMDGKKIVSVKGSSNVKLFKELNENGRLRAKIETVKDNAEAFAMLDSGKADGFIMDDVILYELRAASKNPKKFAILPDLLNVEPKTIMMRPDDESFKRVVDREIHRIITQREIDGIYRKWFESPIPPRQINLEFPLGSLLRESFKSPTDWVPN